MRRVRTGALLISFGILTAFAVVFDVSAVIFLSRLWHDIWAWIIYGGAILFSAVWLTLFLLFKKELKTVLLSTSFRPVKKLNESPFFALITGNYSARTALMSALVGAWNIFYTCYLIFMSVRYSSDWYGSLAGFYAMLVLMYAGIIITEATLRKRGVFSLRVELIIFVVVGALFILAAGVMIPTVIQMAIGGYPAGGNVAEMAINCIPTFLRSVSAVTNIVRAKRSRSLTAFALRNIGLVSALMSLMLLEVSIVRLYANGYSMWEMVSVIGAVFDGVVLFMGLYMIIKGALTYRKREAGMASDSPHADSASFPDEKETAVAEPDASENGIPLPAPPSDKKSGCGGSPPDAAENDPG